MSNGFPSASPASWDYERYRHGSVRWYAFEVILAQGLLSAGGTRSLTSPVMVLSSGACTATPQNRGCEGGERGRSATSDMWKGTDGLNYWGRPHRISVQWCMNTGSLITPATGRLYAGIFLQQPGNNGLPPMPANPVKPQVYLRYARNGTADPGGPDERFELITAIGNGTPYVLTRLTNVPAPISDLTGDPANQRLEIVYVPNTAVYAFVDGKLGAVNTTGLPNAATRPSTIQVMGGCGVYIEAGQVGDLSQAGFHDLRLEGYRP